MRGKESLGNESKENRYSCSLSKGEKRKDVIFVIYPCLFLVDYNQWVDV